MRVLRTLAVVGLIAIAGWTPTCAAERVDLLLVLAADISRSVDEVKFQLQRSGYAAAFSDSRVIEAIRSGPNGRIAVALVEWSGPLSQKIVIDWMVISDDKTARLFGDHIVEASRAFADSTSISAGIDFAMTQLDRAPYETRRRVIDVSGDGDNNSGRDVTAARDEAIAKETMKGPAESGQICSVGRRKIAKKIAKNKRCYANTLRPRSRMLLKGDEGGLGGHYPLGHLRRGVDQSQRCR
jgi:hypothetical protein